MKMASTMAGMSGRKQVALKEKLRVVMRAYSKEV